MARTRADVRKTDAALSEPELQRYVKKFKRRFKRLEDQYLVMIGEQLRDIGELAPSDVHRLAQMRRMSMNLATLERRIGRAVDMSGDDIHDILVACAENDARIGSEILGLPDTINVSDNAWLKRIIEAQYKETVGVMRNLSNSEVVSSHYKNAVDEAIQAVQTGVDDYETAIGRVIREAGTQGLRIRENGTRAVQYKSGYTRRLDTAVRMNVLDGVRHMNQDIFDAIGKQFGADGVEIDAHMLCAEDHLPYQGQQYSNEEFEEIQDSLPRPFGEWNCRHFWHPIMLGISPRNYSDKTLLDMKRYSTEPIDIDGKRKTRYEWSQEMRDVETAIRQNKDTAILARACGNEKAQQRCKLNILRLDQRYDELSSYSGIERQNDRLDVYGFRDTEI